MKTAYKFLAAALAALFFASCSHDPIYVDSDTGQQISQQVAYNEKGSSTKDVIEAPVVVKSQKKGCTSCGSWYCPKPGCCGTISNRVLSRATAQGGSGEPHIGLIPTMKTLAPEL